MEEMEKQLWGRVSKYLPWLGMVPFLKMVAVCNNLAFGRADEKSDIDLFIVAKAGRLFIVRSFVSLVFQFLGVRRHGKYVSGRFCLSFFVDETAINLSPIAIKDDLYLALWCKTLKPVLDDGTAGRFWLANDWCEKFFKNGDQFKPDYEHLLTGRLNWLAKFLEFVLKGRFGDFLERRLMVWQVKRAMKKAALLGTESSLVINEHMLKFHNVDRRAFFRDRWRQKYGEGALLTKEKVWKI